MQLHNTLTMRVLSSDLVTNEEYNLRPSSGQHDETALSLCDNLFEQHFSSFYVYYSIKTVSSVFKLITYNWSDLFLCFILKYWEPRSLWPYFISLVADTSHPVGTFRDFSLIIFLCNKVYFLVMCVYVCLFFLKDCYF